MSRAVFAGAEALASATALCLGTQARGWTFGTARAESRMDVELTFVVAR